ncbi:hypothetical protein, partial [Pseudomonas savastanoi]|uniref:hypothetical protein n=3 Tax=Pseudomonas savastanoi TaxID=29438 RepID=UPI001969E8E1
RYGVVWSSDTSIWRAFSPKWVSGFIRPLQVPESVSVRLNLLMLENLRFEALRYAQWPWSLLALSLVAKLVDGVFEFPAFADVANGLFCAAFAMAFAPMLMEWRRRKST